MSSDTTANVEQVLRLIEGFKTLDIDVIGAALTDDATWEIPADPSRLAVAGKMDRAGFLELIGGLGAALPGGVVLTPVGITAEGDRVAVEATGRGETADGYVYANRYHFLFELRGGKIASGKEFCDTLAVAAFFAHLTPEPAV